MRCLGGFALGFVAGLAGFGHGLHADRIGPGIFGLVFEFEAVALGDVKQRADAHPTPSLDALPGVAGVGFVVPLACLAPGIEETEAIGAHLGLDGHAHACPLFTRKVWGHAGQGGPDQLGRDVSFHALLNRSPWVSPGRATSQ